MDTEKQTVMGNHMQCTYHMWLTTTKRQCTSHQIHTTKHHKFTLTLNPPSLQNKTTEM